MPLAFRADTAITICCPRHNDVNKVEADGPQTARTKVREMVEYGADLSKMCATGSVLSKGDEVGAQQLTLEEMKAIVEEAHKPARHVAEHAHRTTSIRDAILASADSVEHRSLIDTEGIKLARE